MKASIKEIGLIHPPTVDEHLNMLAGRRRFQALWELYGPAYEMDVTVLPVNGDILKAFRVTIVENLQRKPLTDPEMASTIKDYDDIKRKLEGKAKAGGDRQSIGHAVTDGWSLKKTADDLSISKPAVVKAIQIATAIEKHPELVKKKSGEAILRQNRKIELENQQSQAVPIYPDGHGILGGDLSLLSTAIPNNTADLFFTDPPYAEDNLHLFGELASLAQAKLKPGGLCLVYTPHIHLSKIIKLMEVHLDYWWIFGVAQTGQEPRIWSRHLWIGWKPILAFIKSPHSPRLTDTWLRDWVKGEGEDKRFHEWGQDIREAAYFIEALCPPEGLVIDTFCGGGTIPAACKVLGRRWYATEVQEEVAAVARKRLAEIK